MCIEPPRPCETPVLAAEQLGHDLVGVGAARQRVAVRAVGGDQVVLVAHRAHGADDRRLLADREVQEAADLRLRVHLARALLEAPDEHHRLEPLARSVAVGQIALLGLFLGSVGHGVRTLAIDPLRPPLPYPLDSHAHVLGSLLGASGGGLGAARAPCALARVGAARARRVGPRRARGARGRDRRRAPVRGAAGARADRRGSAPAARGRGGSGPVEMVHRVEAARAMAARSRST